MMRIGICVVGSKGWQGGVVYIHNVLRALKATHGGQFAAYLITDDGNVGALNEHAPIIEEGLLAGLIHVGASRVTGTATFPVTCIPAWEGLRPLVDVVFPGGWAPYFDAQVLCWIPDFQYRHLPQFFPPAELDYRHKHDARIATHARHVVFSSEDALRDFRAMFPQSAARTDVLHFFSTMPAAAFDADAAAVARRYGCATDYLICCNQFWAHKNHRVLFSAMRLLWSRGVPLQLVCTGSPSDHRNNAYYGELQAELAAWNTADQVRFLGLIPRDDQVQLLRQARAVVQPSLFEGWSTVVEDARSLGIPLFVSDIAVHREQDAPNSRFFAPHDPGALADLIQEHLAGFPRPGRAREDAGRRHTAALVEAFGNRLWSLLNGIGKRRPLIATSLAPKKVERQQAAVASWIAQGFDVVSVNPSDEIPLLAAHFPGVNFRVSATDARALAGKPLVPLDEVLRVLREENRPLSGIVNSDIVLKPLGDKSLADALPGVTGDGVAFIKRMDQETEATPAKRYDVGIDAFFFGPKALSAYPSTPYFLGLPWWDYFFAAYPILAGLPTREVKDPVAWHIVHPSFYDVQKHWVPLAIETVERLSPLFPNNGALLRDSGMADALASVQQAVAGGQGGEALTGAFMQLARAMIVLIDVGSCAPGAAPSQQVASRRLRLGVSTVDDAASGNGVQQIIHLVGALARLPADERPELTLVVQPRHAKSIGLYAAVFPLVDQILVVGFSDVGRKSAKLLAVAGPEDLFRHIDFLFPGDSETADALTLGYARGICALARERLSRVQ